MIRFLGLRLLASAITLATVLPAHPCRAAESMRAQPGAFAAALDAFVAG